MKTYLRTLKFGGPYGRILPLFLLCVILGITFQTLSFSALAPILKVIFSTEEEIASATVSDMPNFEFSISYFKSFFSWGKAYLISGNDKVNSLKLICIWLIASVFLSNFFSFFSKYISAYVKARMIRRLRVHVFEKITRLHISFFTNEKRGDIISRLTNDIYEIEITFVSALFALIKEPIMIVVIFIVLFTMSAKLTIFTLIVLPLSGLFIAFITKKLRKKAIKGQKYLSNILAIIDETIHGIKIIKGFNAEGTIRSKFLRENLVYQKTLWSMDYKKDLASPVSQFLGTSVVAVILYYGGSLVLKGEGLAPENFFVFIIFFAMIITPIKGLVSMISVLQRGLVAATRVYEIVDTPEIPNSKDAVELNEFKSEIEFRDVSFSYEQENVLNKINLKIPKGQTVALVGSSGGGKSTLADLIPRFHDVTEGQINVDGKNIKDYTFESLRDKMGIVTQESILFNDSVYNNISMGKPNATMEEVVAAAKAANAHNFVTEMEKGYDSEIGDKGTKLSGGQRQRLSIARAILKNPPILILDEATSALDTQSEKLVQEALSNIMKNRTSIVIAHRLSTIQKADCIVVINEGKIVESGTHEELNGKENGFYKKLKSLQS